MRKRRGKKRSENKSSHNRQQQREIFVSQMNDTQTTETGLETGMAGLSTVRNLLLESQLVVVVIVSFPCSKTTLFVRPMLDKGKEFARCFFVFVLESAIPSCMLCSSFHFLLNSLYFSSDTSWGCRHNDHKSPVTLESMPERVLRQFPRPLGYETPLPPLPPCID